VPHPRLLFAINVAFALSPMRAGPAQGAGLVYPLTANGTRDEV